MATVIDGDQAMTRTFSCAAVHRPREQSPEELDRLGVLEVSSVTASVREQCDGSVLPVRLTRHESVCRRPCAGEGDGT
eukprot:scaffold81603_cov26-Tisochrysis_lutea.AAC.1